MELALQEEIISQANGLSPLCEWKIADDQGFWLVLTMLRATRAWLVTLMIIGDVNDMFPVLYSLPRVMQEVEREIYHHVRGKRQNLD